MYVLDTDTLSNYLGNSRNYPQLTRRIQQTDNLLIFASAISVEEYLRFVLANIQRDRNTPRIVERYATLLQFLEEIRAFTLLPFDAQALAEFTKIPSAIRQHHPNDCRIAAIAIARGFTVVTRNTRHFAHIPGVTFDDWTVDTSAEGT